MPDEVREQILASGKEESLHLFSRNQAVRRCLKACSDFGIVLGSDSTGTIEENNVLEIGKSKIQIREVNGAWYGLLYDSKTRRHYYIGLDGRLVMVKCDLKELPSINPGVKGELLSEKDLTGDSEEINFSVCKITDAAVLKLLTAQSLFDAVVENIDLANFEDRLKVLSLDEYLALIQKFSGHFATHVTRIGVREMGGESHSAGLGEYFSAAHEVLKAGKLIPTLKVLQQETSTAKIYEGTIPDSIKDTASRTVHLAPEVVDTMYAAEKGNIPFFFFPSEVVFLTRAFSGKFDFDPNQTEYHGYANWEIAGFDPDSLAPSHSLDINLGIVFLPKSTLVDPQTGSKYELRDSRPIIDEEKRSKFRQLLSHPEVVLSQLNQIESQREAYLKALNHDFSFDRGFREGEYASALRKIFEPLGLIDLDFEQMRRIDDSLSEWIENWSKFTTSQMELDEWVNLWVGDPAKMSQDEKENAFLNNCLFKISALYKKSQNTIRAEEYWENWFVENNARPARVVYYDGDPTEAVAKFLLENKIILESDVVFDYRQEPIAIKDRRDIKPKIPKGTAIDIGSFQLHEWGNWMYRIAELE